MCTASTPTQQWYTLVKKRERYFGFTFYWNAFDIDICLQRIAFLRLKLRNIYVCIRWIYEICVVCFNFFTVVVCCSFGRSYLFLFIWSRIWEFCEPSSSKWCTPIVPSSISTTISLSWVWLNAIVYILLGEWCWGRLVDFILIVFQWFQFHWTIFILHRR